VVSYTSCYCFVNICSKFHDFGSHSKILIRKNTFPPISWCFYLSGDLESISVHSWESVMTLYSHHVAGVAKGLCLCQLSLFLEFCVKAVMIFCLVIKKLLVIKIMHTVNVFVMSVIVAVIRRNVWCAYPTYMVLETS
jgi:hypothetical protein